MSALDDALGTLALARAEQSIVMNHMLPQARAELAQLRATAAEAQAAHVYLDESPVNDPNDPPLELADRCARLVNTIIEQARQLDEARIFAEYVSRRALWTESTLSHSAAIWLAANPAPQDTPQ